ncbi:MAG: hypothetical protein K0R28_2234 [Paenibacillus sp.]|nr:hypothetical protein [Paenibacillus sp.]
MFYALHFKEMAEGRHPAACRIRMARNAKKPRLTRLLRLNRSIFKLPGYTRYDAAFLPILLSHRAIRVLQLQIQPVCRLLPFHSYVAIRCRDLACGLVKYRPDRLDPEYPEAGLYRSNPQYISVIKIDGNRRPAMTQAPGLPKCFGPFLRLPEACRPALQHMPPIFSNRIEHDLPVSLRFVKQSLELE